MVRSEDELGANADAELEEDRTAMRLATTEAVAIFRSLLASLFIVTFLLLGLAMIIVGSLRNAFHWLLVGCVIGVP